MWFNLLHTLKCSYKEWERAMMARVSAIERGGGGEKRASEKENEKTKTCTHRITPYNVLRNAFPIRCTSEISFLFIC